MILDYAIWLWWFVVVVGGSRTPQPSENEAGSGSNQQCTHSSHRAHNKSNREALCLCTLLLRLLWHLRLLWCRCNHRLLGMGKRSGGTGELCRVQRLLDKDDLGRRAVPRAAVGAGGTCHRKKGLSEKEDETLKCDAVNQAVDVGVLTRTEHDTRHTRPRHHTPTHAHKESDTAAIAKGQKCHAKPRQMQELFM